MADPDCTTVEPVHQDALRTPQEEDLTDFLQPVVNQLNKINKDSQHRPNPPLRLQKSQQAFNMITPHYGPRIHLVPMVATKEGFLVPMPPPPNYPAIQHLQSFPPPRPLLQHQPHQLPVARLKPIPLSTTASDVTPASQSCYLEEAVSSSTRYELLELIGSLL